MAVDRGAGRAPRSGPQLRSALDVKLVARPASPAEAVREYALDAVYGVRGWFAQFVDDFRRSDRFFKFKTGIVAAWVAVSVVTMFATCHGAGETSMDVSNSIGAYARFQKSADLGVSVLLVENHSDDKWEQVSLTVNDAFSTLVPFIDGPRGRAVIELRKFNGPAGETPPPDLGVTKLEIRCSEGRAVLDMAESR